ncbi:unnamed protein product [Merluccius merluccius]
MGRLDDAAKVKVVELRKAGLSFRKIKAVLELENIKVSAQAIYLYLREFQGRPPGRARAEEAGSSLATPQGPTRTAGRPEPWNNAQLQNLLREASHQANCIVALEFAKKAAAGSEARPNSSGSGDARGGGRPEQHDEGNNERADIQIVSVTSLAQNSQQRQMQSSMARTVSGPPSTTVAASLASLRRRVTPSPATNPILAARKRLLDKALSHRAKVTAAKLFSYCTFFQSFQQMGPPLRRCQPSITGEELRRVMARGHEKYNLTDDNVRFFNVHMRYAGHPGGANDPRRVVTQRPAPSVRSPQPPPPPRVGVRLPDRAPAPLTSSAPRTPLIRLQAPGGQGTARRDGNVSPQQKEAATRSLGVGGGGLQDQVQLLATEVRGLGVAVKMLVEQQSRLEREQIQQTRVQKQILGALQGLASRLGPCRSVQQQPDKTPTPPSVPTASAAASFSEDTFTYSQGTYTPCSQAQATYNSIDDLEIVEAFKLPELRSTSINGFPPCSNAEPLSHSYTQAQPYTTAYTQQHSQTAMPCYTQSLVQTYPQSNAQPFRGLDGKVSEFPSSCLEGSLRDCNIPPELVINSNHSSIDNQLNIIKVEDT